MKKSRLIGALCAAVFCIVSLPAHSVIVGDTASLQVTETTDYSGNDMDAIFDETTGRCGAAACLLDSADDHLTDYIRANTAEVDVLFQRF